MIVYKQLALDKLNYQKCYYALRISMMSLCLIVI